MSIGSAFDKYEVFESVFFSLKTKFHNRTELIFHCSFPFEISCEVRQFFTPVLMANIQYNLLSSRLVLYKESE